jgi:NAD(P)-dependent dehydrogenase (short-subunit alcohol dehydrogenase family)
MQLQGQVAVITGGVSGLGRGTAELFVEQGAKVVLFDVNDELGRQAQHELGAANALFVNVDVTSEASVQAGLSAAVARFGEVRICINCAGVAISRKTLGRDGPHALEEFQRTVTVNLVGTFNVMRLAAAVMSGQQPVGADGERGVIINTASVAAFEGQMGQAAYSASKGGVAAMTLPAARDLAQHGIRVMCIAPGIISTPMLHNSLTETVRDALIGMVQFPKRLGHPGDFGALARDIVQNPYLNAEVIRLDAGMRLQAR